MSIKKKKQIFFHLDKWNESVLIVSFLGHFVAPVVVHAFCNHMGFPAFQEVMSHPNTETRHKLMASFVIGLVMWMALLYPITSPFLYSNDIYDLWFQAHLLYQMANYLIQLLFEWIGLIINVILLCQILLVVIFFNVI